MGNNVAMKEGTYERTFKLWNQLWKLVSERKRHLETMSALLQRLIFEKQGWPKFKNWEAICKIGTQNRFMMLVLATLDLEKDPGADRIIAAFPECFSEQQLNGPVPLSFILQKARENGLKDCNLDGARFPMAYNGIPSWIPAIGFDKFGNNAASINGPRLPEGISPDSPQGAVVVWEGKRFVVVENNESCEEIWIVPEECVRMDL